MRSMLGLLIAGLLLTAIPVQGDGVAPGNWKISTISAVNGNLESTTCILTLANTDGKTTATLTASDPRFINLKLVSFQTDGKTVRVVLNNGFNDVAFEGTVADDGKRFVGIFGPDDNLSPATMVPTDQTALDVKDVSKSLGIEQMTKAAALLNGGPQYAAQQLRFQALQTTDAAEKKHLLDEAAAADKKVTAELRLLYNEVLAKHPGTVAATIAAQNLIRKAANEATPQDFAMWAEAASKAAAIYGPVWETEVHINLVSALLSKMQNKLALEYALKAEKQLGATASIDQQIKVLTVLRQTVEKDGKIDTVKQITARLEMLEMPRDKEYLAKVPNFAFTPFQSRKGPSNRIVVLELFTGAQCPPCVAADVAFDALLKTYQITDVVMMQYHVHIPSPDPLTNSDAEARHQYYKIAHKSQKFGGTPGAVFNGSTPKTGGGAMANSENVYKAYRELIEPMLETPAACQVKTTAKKVGNQIDIKAKVVSRDNPGADVKLRLVLVEQTVRYVGTNKIRFHHNVVRAMPGGADGKAVTGKNFKTTATVDLAELRKTLTAYLDNYADTVRPFPRPEWPMDFNNLRVIALVQDDATHEILQAAEVEVSE
jgi:hypothetical protein